jgi:hypothetical protein
MRSSPELYRVKILETALKMASSRFTPIQMAFIKERTQRLGAWIDLDTELADLGIQAISSGKYGQLFTMKDTGNVLVDKKMRIVFGVIDSNREVIVLGIYDSWNLDSAVRASVCQVFERYANSGEPASCML